MFSNHPTMAKRWAAHTPKGKDLPEHVKKANLIAKWVMNGLEKRASTPTPIPTAQVAPQDATRITQPQDTTRTIRPITPQDTTRAPSKSLFNPAQADSAMKEGIKIFKNVKSSSAGWSLRAAGALIGQPPNKALPRTAANLTWLKNVQPYVSPNDSAAFNTGIRRMVQGNVWARDTLPKGGPVNALLGAGAYWAKKPESDTAMNISRRMFPTQFLQNRSYVNSNLGVDTLGRPLK